MEHKENFYFTYQEDFRRLNSKLAKTYGKNQSMFQSLLNQSIEDLDEVSGDKVVKLLFEVISDFTLHEVKPLTVFTLDQMVGYIESASKKGAIAIRSYY
ncbi:hypothetical protein FBF83_00790 [Pseudalkalibacillus hwajinpoensis]|uniref:Uncharacterized protein n=2 Tax=Guptibacillus hwajinpoensis TaxID=208199 RepID=A0A4U1MLQ1_9BACL|nr:hypothetical protein FBF83_00790 [Pseudalkalibacillus hwajinpoensis]